MPRMNLSEEEASMISRWRARHAEDLGFNDGIEEALGQLHIFIESERGLQANWKEQAFKHIRSFKRKISLP